MFLISLYLFLLLLEDILISCVINVSKKLWADVIALSFKDDITYYAKVQWPYYTNQKFMNYLYHFHYKLPTANKQTDGINSKGKYKS